MSSIAKGEIKKVHIGDRWEYDRETKQPVEVRPPDYSNPYWIIKFDDGTTILTDYPVLVEFKEKDDC